VGSEKGVTVRSIVETIERQTGREGLVNYGGRPDSPTDPPVVIADTSRLTAATGWAPRYDLESGLHDTLEWWKEREAVR
jgi:nucleoside-diphosphate-sugar epimerase